MQYIEMSIEEASKLCKKNAVVLVAVSDLSDENTNVAFIRRNGNECEDLFNDAKTVLRTLDDFVKKLDVFTEEQNARNIKPKGEQRTILLKLY